MKNIWIQHLEKQRSRDSTRGSSFVEMLHSLARLDDGCEVKSVKPKHSGNKNRQYSLKKIREELAFDSLAESDTENTEERIPAGCKAEEMITEICRWTAKSQMGYETGIDSYEDDYVRLLRLQNGQLVLRYNVAGEDTFEIEVGSTEEADNLISEDNMTTSELYPANPELQWNKK
ncbi:hypothetical protein [Methanolobus halotolerans]|uniref:Uncharacterized protein n=1 Tax=Methanolobus halotolerans TaxID=2052935 RepID=A0A4E0PX76_9EURY|nr:hypothetical protein [Methanolobus halotolerans]TGC10715.1 hypothetical protein CUN85_04405 [Methanolobus halotolerans]